MLCSSCIFLLYIICVQNKLAISFMICITIKTLMVFVSLLMNFSYLFMLNWLADLFILIWKILKEYIMQTIVEKVINKPFDFFFYYLFILFYFLLNFQILQWYWGQFLLFRCFQGLFFKILKHTVLNIAKERFGIKWQDYLGFIQVQILSKFWLLQTKYWTVIYCQLINQFCGSTVMKLFV